MAVATPAAAPAATGAGTTAPARRRAGAVLLVGLLATILYAAFARGSIDIADEVWLQVLLAVLALAAATAWLTGGSLRVRAHARAWWGLGLLLAFAAWSALSLLWSVAPEQTWSEFNRALEYALVVAVALAVGSSDRRALDRFALGWLVVATLIALYALGGKLAPWLHVGGLLDLNQTAVLSRLRAPLDYWNALALTMVLAVPVAIARAADPRSAPRPRLWSLLSLSLLLTVIALSYSRGGVLALLVVLAVLTFVGGRRLRPAAVFAVAALSTAPGLAYAFSQHALTTDGLSVSSRTGPGLVLALIVALSLAALWLAGGRLIERDRATTPAPEHTRAAWRAAALAVGAVALVAVALAAGSSRGLGGTISHQVSSFAAVKRDRVSDPARLLSTNSGNRWVWWKEAAGAFSARPLQGWGAGSFVITHQLYRKPPLLPVRQPHNLPLQLLAEDGIVGALLAGGALIALLVAALARARELAAAGPERERDALLALACVAAGLAWLVHGLIDWDWDIPGVTIPALALLGVAAAVPVGAPPPFARRPGPLGLVGLGAVTLALCAFGGSAILPAWSQSKDRHAIGVAAASSDPARLAAAAADADLAARLNPLATAPLTDAATIAANRGLQAQARNYLVEAVRRAPYDAAAWSRLALTALDLGDRSGAHSAALRATSLDPINAAFAGIAAETELLLAAPQDSATATGTPLPQPPPPVATALSPAGLTAAPAPTPAPPAVAVPRR